MTKIYQFKMSDDVEALLDKILEVTDIVNRPQIIRDALAYFSWIVEQAQNKKVVISLEECIYKKLKNTGELFNEPKTVERIIMPTITNYDIKLTNEE